MKAWKAFHFEAAHSLPDNPAIHGHSYTVRVFFETSAANPVRLSAIEHLEWQLKRSVDHTNLNNTIASPTMEGIADYLTFMARTIISTQNLPLVLLRVDVERPTLMFGVCE